MDEHNWLATQFEAQRPYLRAVAYRMLGSLPEAEDAVQEGWLHLFRSDQSGIENLRGWLTTVVARICLNMLRAHCTERSPQARRGHTLVQQDRSRSTRRKRWSFPTRSVRRCW